VPQSVNIQAICYLAGAYQDRLRVRAAQTRGGTARCSKVVGPTPDCSGIWGLPGTCAYHVSYGVRPMICVTDCMLERFDKT
jgi:hypothetical protein